MISAKIITKYKNKVKKYIAYSEKIIISQITPMELIK